MKTCQTSHWSRSMTWHSSTTYIADTLSASSHYLQHQWFSCIDIAIQSSHGHLDLTRAILWSSTKLDDFDCFPQAAILSQPHPPLSILTRLIGIHHFSVQSKSSKNLVILCLFHITSSLSSILNYTKKNIE